MNFIQYITALVLAVVFAVTVLWNALASQGTATVAARQLELQSGIEKARVQQRVLEQIIQRTAVLGQNDPAIVALLGKYGLSIKANAPAPSPSPASNR